MFSNMEIAYDTLSDEIKDKVKDKRAIHSSLGAAAFVEAYKEMEGNGNLDEYSNSHPVVRTHPETGKKILYVNSMYTKRILDLDENESSDILNEIFFKPVILVSGYVKETFLNSILPFKSILIFSLDMILFSSLRNWFILFWEAEALWTILVIQPSEVTGHVSK